MIRFLGFGFVDRSVRVLTARQPLPTTQRATPLLQRFGTVHEAVALGHVTARPLRWESIVSLGVGEVIPFQVLMRLCPQGAISGIDETFCCQQNTRVLFHIFTNNFLDTGFHRCIYPEYQIRASEESVIFQICSLQQGATEDPEPWKCIPKYQRVG